MEERRRCTTVRQLELMVDYLRGHQGVAIGRVRSKEARAVASRCWERLADILNAEGPARTGKEWAKVWNDYKCRVRSKIISINTSLGATGGGPGDAPSLTPLEDAVAAIIGRDVGPLPSVRHNMLATNDNNVEMDVVPVEDTQVDGPNASSSLRININEADIAIEHIPFSPVLEAQPVQLSPVPSLTGQAPSLQTTPRRTPVTNRQRRVLPRHRALIRPARIAPTGGSQSSTNPLEEARRMVLRIEELRAEAALKNAEAALRNAESFSQIARSIDNFSLFLQRQQNQTTNRGDNDVM